MENYPPEADSLLQILHRLRAPDGCPWDRKQTRESLVRHLESECAELIDAIEKNDPPHICEELGDVLMNLLFQVVVAEEKGEFTLPEVWEGIISKMIRRHAHVFGDAHAANAEEVTRLWEQIKAQEKALKNSDSAPESLMDEVKPAISALSRAEKLQKKAAGVKFDWPDAAGIMAKIREECAELEEAMADGDDDAIDDEIGDLLFSAVNLIRFRSRRSSEEIMRRANVKFESRFRALEKCAADSGRRVDELSPEEMDALWQQIKRS